MLVIEVTGDSDVAAQRMLIDPLFGMARPAHPPEFLRAESHEHAVLDDPAIVVAHHGIQALAVLCAQQVARDQFVHQLERVGPGNLDHLFAGDIPKTGDLAHGPIFVQRIGDLVGFEIAVVQLELAGDPADHRVESRVLQPLAESRRAPLIGRNAHVACKLASPGRRVVAHSVVPHLLHVCSIQSAGRMGGVSDVILTVRSL